MRRCMAAGLGLLALGAAQAALPPTSVQPLRPLRPVPVVEASPLHRGPAAASHDFRVLIDCRIRQFIMALEGEVPMLLDGAQAIALQPSTSDPGQRFESADDPSTYVHAHGTDATVAMRGVRYAACSLLR